MKWLLGTGQEPAFLTVLSAPLFFLLFLAIIWLVYRAADKGSYDRYSTLPLDDE